MIVLFKAIIIFLTGVARIIDASLAKAERVRQEKEQAHAQKEREKISNNPGAWLNDHFGNGVSKSETDTPTKDSSNEASN